MSQYTNIQRIASIEESLKHQPDAPSSTSRERHWQGVTIDLHNGVKTFHLEAPALDHHLVMYTPQGVGRMVQRRAGQLHESVIRTGSVILMPAGLECTWHGTATPTIRMRMPTHLLGMAAEELGIKPNRGAELRNVFHTRDTVIGHLGGIFADELDRPSHPAQDLLVQSASLSLAAHLLRGYDTFGVKQARPSGLGSRHLNTVLSYIEENAGSKVTLDELAALANVSRFHFARLFRTSTGISPMAYVERSRLLRAQALIREERLTLAQIAALTGFADQSHFARRFRLQFGYTPSAYALEHRRLE